MKQFGKGKDGVIDDLLRARFSRSGNARQCSGFDPDLANAYIERRLSGGHLSRYENHLSECGACRKNVVALSGLAAAEISPAPFASAPRSASPSFANRIFGWMSAPQWAMAAAAVVVLAVSLPLILSRNGMQLDKAASNSIAESKPAAPQQSAPEPLASENARLVAAASPKADVQPSKQRGLRESEPGLASDALAVNSRPKPEAVAAASALKDDKKANTTTDQVQQKTETGAAAPAPPPAAAQSQLAKTDSDAGRQQQGKEASQPAEARGERDDSQSADKQRTARSESVQPPAASSTPPVNGRKRGIQKLALRDSEEAEAVRPAERKLNGKTFLFKDGAWTDKGFDPEHNLPIVTIIRDSNVYKEVLAKYPKLKSYLGSFSPTERAVVVYKGTVYKLIPQ